MSKKFSIVSTIDLNKLNHKINEYIMQTGEANPYIFMSKDTLDAIDEAFPTNFREPFPIAAKQGTVGYWEGYRIFTNNDLQFGEVEIR